MKYYEIYKEDKVRFREVKEPTSLFFRDGQGIQIGTNDPDVAEWVLERQIMLGLLFGRVIIDRAINDIIDDMARLKWRIPPKLLTRYNSAQSTDQDE